MALSNAEIAGLAEEDRVHRRLYTDPAIFELEMQRIWGRAWIYVGHASQIPEPGDYYTTTIGREPVIMVRHQDHEIYVLVNRCAHKGAQVVGDESGHLTRFRCSYHGWTYRTDGSLATIPIERGYTGTRYGREAAEARLARVPRCASHRGFVFASLDPGAPDLEDWLGETRTSIDNMCDRAPAGELQIAGGVLRYLHDSNWKMFVENLNDMMHPMVVHQSSSETARCVIHKLLGEEAPTPAALEILAPFTNTYEFFDRMGLHAFPYGHSYSGGKQSIHSNYTPVPGYHEAMVAAYGEARTHEIMAIDRHNTVIYPSFTLKGPIQTIRVVKPLAVDRTLIESWTLRLRGAPEHMLQRSILYCNLINSSANLVGPDDWESYHRCQQGLGACAREWVSLHRELGRDHFGADGSIEAIGTSDAVFRNQYRAWRYYMSGQGGWS